jgi:hypothetical protein
MNPIRLTCIALLALALPTVATGQTEAELKAKHRRA